METKSLNQKKKMIMELFEKERQGFSSLTELQQNEEMDIEIRNYQEGNISLLQLYVCGLMIAGTRSESYLQARVPFQARLELYEKFERAVKGKKKFEKGLPNVRRNLIGDAA